MSSPVPAVSRAPYGTLSNGEAVEAITLSNANGMRAVIITFGGVLTELHVPDAKGQTANVTLGCRNLPAYEKNACYFGTLTGRIAGRLCGARFTVDGREYKLVPNNSKNHIHGGLRGISHRLWSVGRVFQNAAACGVELFYNSPDGEERYPGNVRISATYTLTSDYRLRIEFSATTDAPTPLCLTHHAYFNLAGENSGTIHDHLLKIDAAHYIPTGDDLGPLGRIDSVTAVNDFRTARVLGETIPNLWKQHGDMYHFRANPEKELRTVAVLTDPKSCRTLSVRTTESFMQFYSGFYLEPSASGPGGTPYEKHAGIALECQGFPDGPNHPEIDDIILRPGKTYRAATEFCFSNENPS